jgi:hypothetical protein
VQFEVFKSGKKVEKFLVCGAYMFGTDGTSMRRTKISFADGSVTCEKPNADTAGLALLWPIEGFGRILLPTTCLPERERPYCLNLEIARARLMQTISCREDWSLFDGSDELDEVSRQAQSLFVQAIQQSRNPEQASLLADRSLRKAMVFSEKLSLRQAETLFRNRRRSKGFGRGWLGCRLDLNRVNDGDYIEKLAKVATLVQIPVSWADLEREKGSFDFSTIDRAVEVLGHRHIHVALGPLLRFTPQDLPTWVAAGEPTFEKVRDAAYHFVTEMAMRYRRKVHRWLVLGGLNANNCLGFNVEQVLEVTRAANMAVKAVNSRAFKVIEISDLWGEYYASVPNTIAPVGYMDMVLQSGIPFDGFAFNMRFGKNQLGMHVRDMMQISNLLDYFSIMGKPLLITGVEIPSADGEGPFDGRVAGVWHRKWDQVRQALWLEQFYGISLGRGSVESVIYGGLADSSEAAITHSGLLDQSLEPKESYRILTRLRETVQGAKGGKAAAGEG